MKTRLSKLKSITKQVRPKYNPKNIDYGIVHIGIGAFHKAHQAAITDEVIEKNGGDWKIIGVSLRSERAKNELAPQNGLYTLLIKDNSNVKAKVIASISKVLCSAENSEEVIEVLVSPKTKIVSLTVTEKAYGLKSKGYGCDLNHPSVSLDLDNFDQPHGVLGILVKALSIRMKKNILPFTVLCCDNLPNNGKLVGEGVIDFAKNIDPVLSNWIRKNTAFPSTMVDRITPAPTQTTLSEAKKIIGFVDLGAVETEPFYQWIIEDNFPLGRPRWEQAGAIFTDNVLPYEKMKLRMLNGAHSMMAYTGFHSGHKYVHNVMSDEYLKVLIERHMNAASKTLDNISSIDYNKYANSLIERFNNKALKHETLQIAMDGSQKIPQRILFPLEDALKAKINYRPFTFAIAAWLRHISGSTHDCDNYIIKDPLAEKLSKLKFTSNPEQLSNELFNLGLLKPTLFKEHLVWKDIFSILQEMLSRPMKDVICSEIK